jgi:hypothetical protein
MAIVSGRVAPPTQTVQPLSKGQRNARADNDFPGLWDPMSPVRGYLHVAFREVVYRSFEPRQMNASPILKLQVTNQKTAVMVSVERELKYAIRQGLQEFIEYAGNSYNGARLLLINSCNGTLLGSSVLKLDNLTPAASAVFRCEFSSSPEQAHDWSNHVVASCVVEFKLTHNDMSAEVGAHAPESYLPIEC